MNSLINNFLATSLLLSLLLVISCQEQRFVQGERIYKSYCQNCHMEDGQGLGKLIPPIKNSDYYEQHYKDLVCIIKYGMTSKIVVNGIQYEEEMPGVKHLTTAELSNLINYMNAQWYTDKSLVTPKDITEKFSECKEDVQ